MRLLYLGEYIQDSFIKWCLDYSNKFDRIDHLTKPSLNLTHFSMNPLPDTIVFKCDYDDGELVWDKRYSQEIPKIFVACDHCLHKMDEYLESGKVFMVDRALQQKDMFLQSLVEMILQNEVGK